MGPLLFARKLGLFAAIGCFGGCLLGSCGGESTGLAAYRKGDYSAAVREYGKEETPASDFAIGVMHYKGQGVRRDMGKAAFHFRKAAEEGHAAAQYNLGLMYANGQGMRRDIREAARWYGKSAENGFAKAQYNLGIMYARGDGVERDERKSLHWLAKSARQGNPRALKCLKMRLEQKKNAGRPSDGFQKGT